MKNVQELRRALAFALVAGFATLLLAGCETEAGRNQRIAEVLASTNKDSEIEQLRQQALKETEQSESYRKQALEELRNAQTELQGMLADIGSTGIAGAQRANARMPALRNAGDSASAEARSHAAKALTLFEQASSLARSKLEGRLSEVDRKIIVNAYNRETTTVDGSAAADWKAIPIAAPGIAENIAKVLTGSPSTS